MCLLAVVASPLSVGACNGWPHLCCSTIDSCQSTDIVKRGCFTFGYGMLMVVVLVVMKNGTVGDVGCT